MTDRTKIVFSDLPEGQDYAWHPDLDLVELSTRVKDCPSAQQHALDDLQADWRQRLQPSCRVVVYPGAVRRQP